QIFFDQMAAPRHIDHESALGKLREKGRVHDAAGVVGERQHADTIVALGKELRQFVLAGEAFHAWDAFPRAAPAEKLEIERQKAGGDGCADIAQAQYPDTRVVRRLRQQALPPLTLPLHRVVEALGAMSD